MSGSLQPFWSPTLNAAIWSSPINGQLYQYIPGQQFVPLVTPDGRPLQLSPNGQFVPAPNSTPGPVPPHAQVISAAQVQVMNQHMAQVTQATQPNAALNPAAAPTVAPGNTAGRVLPPGATSVAPQVPAAMGLAGHGRANPQALPAHALNTASTVQGLPRAPSNPAQLPQAPGVQNPRATAAAQAMAAQPRAGAAAQVPGQVPAHLAAPLPPRAAAGAPLPASGQAQVNGQSPAQNPAQTQAMRMAQAQAQTLLAQQALTQVLNRMAQGQVGAGAAALALAEGQLALRAGRMALTQAMLQGQMSQLAGMGMRSGAAQGGANAQLAPAGGSLTGQRATAVAGQGPGMAAGLAQAGRGASGAQLAQGLAGSALGATGGAQRVAAGLGVPGTGASGQAAEAARQQGAQAGAQAAMPKALAQALAMAPKQRKKGSYARVEAVSRDGPGRQMPEMEDEDFWDGLEEDESLEAMAGDAQAEQPSAAEVAARHYAQVYAWLQAQGQAQMLRELAAGRRVLVLAPPDGAHQRLVGHLLRPDAAATRAGAVPIGAAAPGGSGRAWALAAGWSAALPADGQWRLWRVRQAVDADGQWCLQATGLHGKASPLLLLQGGRDARALQRQEDARTGRQGRREAMRGGESITVMEPRRLRRLMEAQWTMLVLRVPQPLEMAGAARAAAR